MTFSQVSASMNGLVMSSVSRARSAALAFWLWQRTQYCSTTALKSEDRLDLGERQRGDVCTIRGGSQARRSGRLSPHTYQHGHRHDTDPDHGSAQRRKVHDRLCAPGSLRLKTIRGRLPQVATK